MPATFDSGHRTHMAGRVLLVAACLPLALSLGFHAAGVEARPGARGHGRPALAFDQYLVNLRQLRPGSEAPARFAFRNNGPHEVRITALKPSCGCLQPRLDQHVFQPGEAGEFFLRVQTATEKPGRKEYFVTVHYTDPQPRETRLTFKFVLPEQKVVVEPRSMIVYIFGSGEATSREIILTDSRPRPLTVTGLESSTALATARLAVTSRDAAGNRRTRMEITITGDVPPGRHEGYVSIHTDDPEYPAIRVPLRIERPEP